MHTVRSRRLFDGGQELPHYASQQASIVFGQRMSMFPELPGALREEKGW